MITSEIISILDAYDLTQTVLPNASTQQVVHHILQQINHGSLRVCEPCFDAQGLCTWITHAWIKKAILIYFRMTNNRTYHTEYMNFFDKIPGKYEQDRMPLKDQIRIVPGGHVRYGCYIAPGCVLMPSFVNVGAYIGAHTMIDTWSTIGSCAQIGERVHISGGVGIGGVLEPMHHQPVIIEDDCFIGARSEVTEGVRIGKGSVLGMGVFLSQSTKIYHRENQTITYGFIPPYSVVVPGTLPSNHGCHLSAAIIVKQVDEKTRFKTQINELLREG